MAIEQPDLVFFEYGTKVNVALGNGDGTFRAVRQVSLPRSRGFNYTLSTGDLNGDGRTDIFTAQDTGVLLFNLP